MGQVSGCGRSNARQPAGEDGIELIVADEGDKVSSAELRTAQQSAMQVGWNSGSKRRIDSLDRPEKEGE